MTMTPVLDPILTPLGADLTHHPEIGARRAALRDDR